MNKSNIQQLKDTLDRILYAWYKEVNDYLENILNAPSTINRLLTHYYVGKKVDNPLEMCIIFHGQVVKVFSLDQDVRQRLNDFEWSLPVVKETEVKTENPSTLDISIPITNRLIDSDLLDEILITLETLNHKQVVYLSTLNFKNQDRSETYALEEIDLDILIGKIKMVLK